MVKSYFRIIWRSIKQHKLYSFINITGLAVGICACLVIYLITDYEFSFDRFHPDQERIYRIVGEMQRNTGEKEFINSVFSDVAGFQNQLPGFEVSSGFHFYGEKVSIHDGEKPVKNFSGRVEGGYLPASIITGPGYFDIFKYQWLAGNASTLNEPFKVVLSENSARKYFGEGSLNKMIGKTVIYDDSLQVSVSGIVKDWNKNTDLGFTDFISISTATHSFLRKRIPTEDWNSLSPHQSQVFVKLSKGISPAKINLQMAKYIKDHVKFDHAETKLAMWLQPLSEIHFTSEFHRGDDGDDFRKAYLPTLYTLMFVALFILIIAAVNFINLSTAQSIQRAKEIGIRKVLGGDRKGLFLQFLFETFVLVFFAVIVSVCFVKPVLSAFSGYIPNGVKFNPFNFSTLIFLAAVTLITSFLAGIYPAKVISAYLPVVSLKGIVQNGSGKINLRKGLIVFQFTISLVFIIGVIVVGNQINYMQKSDKGFTTDAIVTLNTVWKDRNGKSKVLVEKLKQIPGIDQAIAEANAPMGFAHRGGGIEIKNGNDIKLQVSTPFSNENFIPFYQMKILAGRNLMHTDSLREFVINETCSRKLGFAQPEEAIGKNIIFNGKPYPVVGVVADFHEGSFHESIGPVVIGHMPEYENNIALKLSNKGEKPGTTKLILKQVEHEWEKIYPDEPFDYSFMNESISRLYEQEKKTAWLMNVAMVITILISGMGLFGLALFTTQKRTKEIGIRKVLGASVAGIVTMLSKDFIKLVGIAFLIASPIAWYFMNQWLQDFTSRTDFSWWVFALAGGIIIVIAFATVSLQAIKTALMNPVKSLRTE